MRPDTPLHIYGKPDILAGGKPNRHPFHPRSQKRLVKEHEQRQKQQSPAQSETSPFPPAGRARLKGLQISSFGHDALKLALKITAQSPHGKRRGLGGLSLKEYLTVKAQEDANSCLTGLRGSHIYFCLAQSRKGRKEEGKMPPSEEMTMSLKWIAECLKRAHGPI